MEYNRDAKELEYSKVLISLLKGVVTKDDNLGMWAVLKEKQSLVQEYLATIGLQLFVDDGAGYAFVRQREDDELPRLVPRHQLSFGLSLLLIQLRKALGDFDAANGDRFLIMTKEDIQLRLKGFYPQLANETRFINEVDRNIKRAVEMGFLMPVYGSEDAYEVRELLRSFVTAQWLQQFNQRLQDYIDYGAVEKEEDNDNSLSLQ